MRFFRARSALVAGAIGLAVAVGAIGIFATERVGAAPARDDDAELEGIIEALPPAGVVGVWQVSGRTVIVTEATEIDQDGQTLAPGLWVEIEGTDLKDGSIVASEIEVEEADSDDDGSTPSATRDDDDDDGPAIPAVFGARDDDDGGSPSTRQGDDD
jgi:Domain of unknown function (DUF5666)